MKRPPRRRVFTVTVGRNGLGYTTLRVATEDGRTIVNSHHNLGFYYTCHNIGRAIEADLTVSPPLDRRGRPNRDDLEPIDVVNDRDTGDEDA